jgi:predicted  nucleic acid-binding Zn-ribbon protein
MEKKNYTEMSNAEIRLAIETIKNEYEAKKNKLVQICKEMEALEIDYRNAENELRIRKDVII